MLTITYCSKCKDELCKHDPFIFEFFNYIVEQYFFALPLEISTEICDYQHNYISMVKFLEQKNYVISTESSHTTIQVKPLGFDKSGQTVKIYCFCKSENDGIQWE